MPPPDAVGGKGWSGIIFRLEFVSGLRLQLEPRLALKAVVGAGGGGRRSRVGSGGGGGWKQRENKRLCAAGRLLGEQGSVMKGGVFIKPSCSLAHVVVINTLPSSR